MNERQTEKQMDVYIEELVVQVKGIIKPDKFSDEQIREACTKTLEVIPETEILPLIDIQSQLCDRCATCCKVCNPIAISTPELIQISRHLKMTPAKTMKKYKMSSSDQHGVYNMKAGPCPFLIEPNICSIYEIRPSVCRGFPVNPMLSDVIQKKSVELIQYCHVVKGLNAYRAVMNLMRQTVEMQEVMKIYEPLMKAFGEQLSKTDDPHKRLQMEYQMCRTMHKLLGLD